MTPQDAIKALEQQPCEDCISREEALKVMCDKCPMYNCVTGCSSYRHIEKLPSVTPKARWIPVSERLPEERIAVLVWCPERKNVYCACYEEKQWWIFGAYFKKIELDVIAWMPLPEPYKAESKIEQSLAYKEESEE